MMQWGKGISIHLNRGLILPWVWYGQLPLRYSSTWWLIRFKLATCKSYLTPVRDTKHGAWLHSDKREDHPYHFFMWIRALLECYIAITEFLQPSPWHGHPSKIGVETPYRITRSLKHVQRGLCSHIDSFHCYLAATNQTSRMVVPIMDRRVPNVRWFQGAMGDSVVWLIASYHLWPEWFQAFCSLWLKDRCAVPPSEAAGQHGWKPMKHTASAPQKKVIENASSLGWLDWTGFI